MLLTWMYSVSPPNCSFVEVSLLTPRKIFNITTNPIPNCALEPPIVRTKMPSPWGGWTWEWDILRHQHIWVLWQNFASLDHSLKETRVPLWGFTGALNMLGGDNERNHVWMDLWGLLDGALEKLSAFLPLGILHLAQDMLKLGMRLSQAIYFAKKQLLLQVLCSFLSCLLLPFRRDCSHVAPGSPVGSWQWNWEKWGERCSQENQTTQVLLFLHCCSQSGIPADSLGAPLPIMRHISYTADTYFSYYIMPQY